MLMDRRTRPWFYALSAMKYQTTCFPRKSFWKSLLVSQKCTFARVPANVLFRRISPLQRLGIRSQNPTKFAFVLWTRAVLSVVYISWGRGNEAQITSVPWNVCSRKAVLLSPPPSNLRRQRFFAEGTSNISDRMAVEWELCQVWVLFSPDSSRC
jgi:hypothetical protein